MTEELSDEEYERQAFRVVAMSDLPDAIVDVTTWGWRAADWAAIARCCEVFDSGVDPLDRAEVERRIGLHDLSASERECVSWMFTDPVAIYEASRRWSVAGIVWRPWERPG